MRVHLLGSGGALTTARRGNTSLAVEGGGRAVLVDCSGAPIQAMHRAGLEWTWLIDVIVTHRHADHIYGLPSLAHQLYVTSLELGRRHELRVHGPSDAMVAAELLLDSFGLTDREGFEVSFETVPDEVHELTLGDLRVTTFPVEHGKTAAIGVKLAPTTSRERAVVYSGDTSLCDAVIDQCQGVPLVFHECSSLSSAKLAGHTSLADIDELAARTTAQRIVLVHLPPVSPQEEGRVRRQLKSSFGGRVQLGEDGTSWEV